MAQAGERLDRALDRDQSEPVTVDLDATQITVYGRHKEGAARCRTGEMSYAPHIAFWAQRGRALTAELVGGNQERLSGRECAKLASRALGLLPDGHGPVTMRVDSGVLRDRTAPPAAPRAHPVHRVAPAQPGDVDGTATGSPRAPGATRWTWKARRSPRPSTGPVGGSMSRSD